MRRIATLLLLSLVIGGCSTRPREFRPGLAAPAADMAAFDRALIRCQVLVRRGVKGNFGNVALQGAAGVGGGFAAGIAAGSAVPATGSVMSLNALTAATSALVVVGPLVGFGVSRMIRSGRERKYKATLGQCMNESGFVVKDWTRQKKLNKAQVKAVMAELEAPAAAPAPSAPEPAANPR